MMDIGKMIEDYILYIILVLIWSTFLWKFYLSLRQKALMERLVDLPTSIVGLMTKPVYDKSRNYALDKLVFSDFDDFYSLVFSTIFLLTYSYRKWWDYSIKTAQYLGIDHENEIYLSMIFVFMMSVILDIVGLPLKIYSTFILEEKYNFNKQTPWFFVKDQLLHFLVMQAIANPVLCAMIWIIKNGGDYFFFHLWIFTLVVTLFLMIIYPEVIAPLFDKYRPLPEGELKQKIEALAASLGFPLYKLFIVEGSKRSSHSNAYLYGFHKYKRIVLFDTLVREYYQQVIQEKKEKEKSVQETEKKESDTPQNEKSDEEIETQPLNAPHSEKSEQESKVQQLNSLEGDKLNTDTEVQQTDVSQNEKSEKDTKSQESKDRENDKSKAEDVKEDEDNVIGCETEEVLAVLAHEIGHWKYSHALKGFILAQVNILLHNLLYAKFLDYDPMYKAFGFEDSKPVFIGLTIVTLFFLIPLNTVMGYVSVVIRRRFEFQADSYAIGVGYGEHLKKALIKLQKDNLGYPLFDKLYSSWHHSHPPLLERLEAIDKYQ